MLFLEDLLIQFVLSSDAATCPHSMFTLRTVTQCPLRLNMCVAFGVLIRLNRVTVFNYWSVQLCSTRIHRCASWSFAYSLSFCVLSADPFMCFVLNWKNETANRKQTLHADAGTTVPMHGERRNESGGNRRRSWANFFCIWFLFEIWTVGRMICHKTVTTGDPSDGTPLWRASSAITTGYWFDPFVLRAKHCFHPKHLIWIL